MQAVPVIVRDQHLKRLQLMGFLRITLSLSKGVSKSSSIVNTVPFPTSLFSQ